MLINHSQEPYEWVDADLGVLWVEPEQKLHFKVVCSNFGPGPILDSAVCPTHLNLSRCDDFTEGTNLLMSGNGR